MPLLTKNFSLGELTRSYTAKVLRLDNTPDEASTERLRLLCRKILQPLRNAWGFPIMVNSGYRSRDVNRHVGGVSNSDHLYGCAADISVGSVANKRLFSLAVEMMKSGELQDVKQIIDEKNYSWIHISMQDGRTKKRNEVLHLK
jgi:zinc D-Ala-D-Ala carboxypeptidase